MFIALNSNVSRELLLNLWAKLYPNNYFFKNLDLIKGPEFIRNSEMAEEKEKPKAKKKAILIMALYRGGSTLAGEFFNRNSDILYFFGKCFIISNL